MQETEKNVENNLSRKNYSSKWDYTLDVSKWHFDKWKKEEDPFKVFLNVKGDWADLLEQIKYPIDVGTVNYGFQGTDHDNIIEKDLLEWGYKKEMVQYQRTYELPEKLKQVAQQLKLEHPDIRIHRQMPGMVAPIHIDTFCSHPVMEKEPWRDVADLRRFVIQLTDWDWGHFWHFGNSTWSHWKAGDAVYFESRDIPHCTANAGMKERVTMIVTGWMSEETKKMVSGEKVQISI